jgi:hypothetical protein
MLVALAERRHRGGSFLRPEMGALVTAFSRRPTRLNSFDGDAQPPPPNDRREAGAHWLKALQDKNVQCAARTFGLRS